MPDMANVPPWDLWDMILGTSAMILVVVAVRWLGGRKRCLMCGAPARRGHDTCEALVCRTDTHLNDYHF